MRTIVTYEEQKRGWLGPFSRRARSTEPVGHWLRPTPTPILMPSGRLKSSSLTLPPRSPSLNSRVLRLRKFANDGPSGIASIVPSAEGPRLLSRNLGDFPQGPET